MDNAEFSGKPQNSLPITGEDIPQALRDTPDSAAPKAGLRPWVLIVGGTAGFVVLAAISGFVFFITAPQKTTEQPVATSTPTANIGSSDAVNNYENSTDTLLGHLKYEQAPESELVAITADKRIRLRSSAAQRYKEMAAAARSAGVILVPISGFRSVKEQEQLFFQVGAQRNQTPSERAALSAPPGHSEHHTGYAIDIGDRAVPATNLNTQFENTKAFKWLQANAARYGFELSFPENNSQGVSYEPWHWRFVGNSESLETFYKSLETP